MARDYILTCNAGSFDVYFTGVHYYTSSNRVVAETTPNPNFATRFSTLNEALAYAYLLTKCCHDFWLVTKVSKTHVVGYVIANINETIFTGFGNYRVDYTLLDRRIRVSDNFIFKDKERCEKWCLLDPEMFGFRRQWRKLHSRPLFRTRSYCEIY